MQALASSGDDPQRQPALPAGGIDECQLLRLGGAQAYGLPRTKQLAVGVPSTNPDLSVIAERHGV